MTVEVDNKMAKAAYAALEAENKMLREEIEAHQKTINNLRSKLFSGKSCKTYKEWKAKKDKALEYYLEAMAAAYYMESDISPGNVVLHTAVKNDGSAHVYYWLENRNDVTDVEYAQEFKLFEE